MKKILLFLTLLLATVTLSFSQNRSITRGAIPGELYLTGTWYGIYNPILGPPYYDTLRTAIYRLTENGKKLTKQYDADYFANPETIMQPNVILTDATPGVVYNKDNYSKNSYAHTALWVSFDYGKNWVFREEDMGSKNYYTTNYNGFIYKTENGVGVFKSMDYANIWNKLKEQSFPPHAETSYAEAEFYCITGSNIYYFYHTFDCFNNYTTITMDSEIVFGQICGIFPDVYRGGLLGEVYISSMFQDNSFKVSFSADTGHTFKHVYVASELYCDIGPIPIFMSDREPCVFYIVKGYGIEDTNPYGWHTKICVEYYRDYGETLVDTYCHDITKDYNNNVGVKGVKELEGVRVYPNATKGELKISFAELAPTGAAVDNGQLTINSVELYDVMGKKQFSIFNSQLSIEKIDISHLQAGIYFVKIKTDLGEEVRKVVKL